MIFEKRDIILGEMCVNFTKEPAVLIYSENCPAPQIHGYDLRADNATMKSRTRTDRFENFVTVKYAV